MIFRLLALLSITAINLYSIDLNIYTPPPYSIDHLHIYANTQHKFSNNPSEKSKERTYSNSRIYYNNTQSNPKYLLNNFASLTLGFTTENITHYTSSENTEYTTNNTERSNDYSPSINININGTNRLYISDDNYLYLFHDLFSSTSFRNEVEYSFKERDSLFKKDYTTSDRVYYRNTGEIAIGVGTGRIKEIDKYRLAHRIINELSQQKLITPPISSTMLEDLADLLISFKRAALFDYRENKKHVIRTVDQFFTEQNCITNKSIEYYAILADYLTLFQPKRLSGSNITALLSVYTDFNISNRDEKNTSIDLLDSTISPDTISYGWMSDQRELKIAAFSQLIYEYHTALTLNLQLESAFSASSGFFHNWNRYDLSNNNDYTRAEGYQHKASAQVSLGYFPGTRTSITSSLLGHYTYRTGQNRPTYTQTSADFNNHFISIQLANSIDWFITDRISLNGTIIGAFFKEVHHSKNTTPRYQYRDTYVSDKFISSGTMDEYSPFLSDFNYHTLSHGYVDQEFLNILYSIELQYALF